MPRSRHHLMTSIFILFFAMYGAVNAQISTDPQYVLGYQHGQLDADTLNEYVDACYLGSNISTDAVTGFDSSIVPSGNTPTNTSSGSTPVPGGYYDSLCIDNIRPYYADEVQIVFSNINNNVVPGEVYWQGFHEGLTSNVSYLLF